MPDFGPDPARHTWRCLAADKVRYVGEGVAVAVADSRYLAEDALELIEVDYEPLLAVVDPEAALAAGAPLVHEALESNCAYERAFDFGDVERDFAEADVIVTDRLRWHRSGGQPLETVGAIASYDPGTGSFTIDANYAELHQLPVHGREHAQGARQQARHQAGAAYGGSFGSKLFANKLSRDRRHVRAGDRQAGGLPGGPDRQHLQLRPPRLRPRLPGRAGDDAGRHHARHQDRRASTTTAPTSSSAWATTATPSPRSPARTRSPACGTGCRRC